MLAAGFAGFPIFDEKAGFPFTFNTNLAFEVKPSGAFNASGSIRATVALFSAWETFTLCVDEVAF